MAQLNLKLTDEQLVGLKECAARRRLPVSWILREYIDHLLTGGTPVQPAIPRLPTAQELANLAETGGAFDWLREEPELYSFEDGEPL